jgi:hypothetical protein
MDYTKYPDGFDALCKECDFPMEDMAQRKFFMTMLLTRLIQM